MQITRTFAAFSPRTDNILFALTDAQHLHYLTAAGFNWFLVFGLC